jgi:hypothetical protein
MIKCLINIQLSINMRFKSLSERMLHPQAKKISVRAWGLYFNGELTDFQVDLMTQAPKDLSSYIARNSDQVRYKIQADPALVAMLYNEATLSLEYVLAVGAQWGLEPQEIFRLAVVARNIDLIQQFVAKEHVQTVNPKKSSCIEIQRQF